MKRISEEIRKQILDLHKQGKTAQQIAEMAGISDQTVRNYLSGRSRATRKCPKCHEGPFPTTYRYCPFCTADMRSEKELLIETLQRAAERLRPPYDDTASALNYALRKAISYLERE